MQLLFKEFMHFPWKLLMPVFCSRHGYQQVFDPRQAGWGQPWQQ